MQFRLSLAPIRQFAADRTTQNDAAFLKGTSIG